MQPYEGALRGIAYCGARSIQAGTAWRRLSLCGPFEAESQIFFSLTFARHEAGTVRHVSALPCANLAHAE